MKTFLSLCLFIPMTIIFLISTTTQSWGQDETLRIIVIGAHPDDCDQDAGGTAIQWAAMGHEVKFLSLTNGDAGHHEIGGGMLAKKRRAEAQEAGRRFGIAEYQVLDNHDGELLPTLNVRNQVIRAIREWQADIVILPRPNDYHPDHRNTGLVVQDAAYMVIVPNVVPEVPPLYNNPVFIYSADRFQRPNPFEPEIAVSIDEVYWQKIHALSAHVSQFFEWLPWTVHRLDQVPEGDLERKKWLAEVQRGSPNTKARASLEKWYGSELANSIDQVEAFEICEYGRQPDEQEIKKLFPMLGKKRVHSPYSWSAVKTNVPVKIDGKLDDPVYNEAEKIWLVDNMTKEPLKETLYRTYAQMAYDDQNLYIGFYCGDLDVHSSFTRRDEYLWKEEAVEVFIETDDELLNYIEIEVSPGNVIYDSHIADPFNIELDKTTPFNLKQMKTAVHVEGSLENRKDQDHAWTVEIAIPISELAPGTGPADLPNRNWKINFYRLNLDDHGPRAMATSPTGGSFHQPLKFGKLKFK